jgi:predicted thioesterase
LELIEGTGLPWEAVPVIVGACGQSELVVTEDDTAAALGTGDVGVLATPRVVQLCEAASLAALGPLPPGETTVGLRVEMTHVAPIAVGTKVVATATLERSEGRRLVFSTSVNDARGLVAAGRVTRVLVSTASFLEKAR